MALRLGLLTGPLALNIVIGRVFSGSGTEVAPGRILVDGGERLKKI